MSFLRRALVALAAALTLAGCSGPAEPPPVLIGHVAAGPEDGPGASAARGIRLAVMEANKAPDKEGAGRTVKVIHTDTLGKLDAFEAEAVRLANVNRVAALLGGTTAEEVERLELARLVLISPSGVQPRTPNDAIFCTGLTPAFQGKALARFAADELKAGRVAILADEARPESVALAEAFAKGDAKDKGPRPAVWRYGKDTTLRDLAGRAREEKAQAVLLAGTLADLRRLKADLAGLKLSFLFGGDEGSVKVLREGTDRGPVHVVTAFALSAEAPQAQAFAEKYRKEFGEEADVRAAVAYDDARILFSALRQTKDTPGGAKLREELTKVKDFAGVTGPLSFGKDRILRRPAFVVRVENGQATTLKRYAPEE